MQGLWKKRSLHYFYDFVSEPVDKGEGLTYSMNIILYDI